MAKFKQPPIYFARGQQGRFQALLAAEEAEWEATRQGGTHQSAPEDTEESRAVGLGAV